MRRTLFAVVVVLLVPAVGQAHFLWLLPEKSADKTTVKLVFSDTLAPDSPDLLDRISKTEAFLVDEAGKVSAVKMSREKDHLAIPIDGTEPKVVAAVCRYGVLSRGQGEPFLLYYGARTFVGFPGSGEVPRTFGKPVERLTLDIVPDLTSANRLIVLWKGKPLAGAEVVLTIPGEKEPVTVKSGKDGAITARQPVAAGLYGVRARHIEKQAGELDGKKYKEIRHYTTLVVPVAGANPEATRLLAEARAARANWTDFPGFKADLAVNVNGQVLQGKIEVNARGQITLTGLENKELETQTRRQLASLVSHRLDGAAELKTPCVFADDVSTHPLGREIRVLNDEFHSSYRIRDRQIIEVNRTMKDLRFKITVIRNQVNAEKQFLPATYLVHYWEAKTNALKRSETFHHTWVRKEKFDLPASVLIVTADDQGKLEARTLTLSGHELLPAKQ